MPSFSVRIVESAAGATFALAGRATLYDAQALWDDLERGAARLQKGDSARFDLSKLEYADGAAIAVLVAVEADLSARGVKVDTVGAHPTVAPLLEVYRDGASNRSPDRDHDRKEWLTRVGRNALSVFREVQAGLAFVGAAAVAAVGVARRPKTANWKAIPDLMERAGATAAPIVFVINFLIGLITAYEFGSALKRFGATVYVPDFVGLSIARELSPLMTAIVAAGRTGASFTAELGSMSVSEEIDALRVLRIDPLRFLVMPRIIALAVALPLLTLMADATGMLGGLLIASLSFDMSAQFYFRELRNVVLMGDILFGINKSVVFAVTIAVIACQQGLATSGGPTGVGRRTTASVVSILFAIILIDALFAPHS